MPKHPFGMAELILLLSLFTLVLGAPQLSFPINSQLPPVARVSEPFEFVFSSSTFTSNIQPIQLALVNAPSWLQFDGAMNKLYGKPAETDVGFFKIKISASDASGAIEDEVTLVVSGDPSLRLDKQISQISNLGPTDGNDGLLVPPNTEFEFNFPDDTFSPKEKVARYDAISSDNTPLPSWINFDPMGLKFSGRAPDLTSLVAPPQSFGITLVASDYPGFAGASVSFRIVVGTHMLYFKERSLQANATSGALFKYQIEKDSIILDGQPIAATNISKLSANTTGWLSFDSQSLTLIGIPPKDAESMSVVVQITDTTDNRAQCTINVSVFSTLFTLDLPDLDIVVGRSFTYSINRTSISSPDAVLSAKIDPTVNWITFDSKNLILNGTVPDKAPESLNVTLTAKTPSGDRVETQSFELMVKQRPLPSGAVSPVPTPTPTKNDTPDIVNNGDADTETVSAHKNKTAMIVLATILPLLLVVGLAVTGFCIMRQKQPKAKSSRTSTPTPDMISRPLNLGVRPLQPLPCPWPLSTNAATEPRQSTYSVFPTKQYHPATQSGGSTTTISSYEATAVAASSSTKQDLTPPPENKCKAIPPGARRANHQRSPPILARNFSRLGHQESQHSKPLEPLERPGRPERPKRRSISEHQVPYTPTDYRVDRRLSNKSSSRDGGLQRGRSRGHGRPLVGGPPGFGLPKKSWRKTASSTTRRESDATVDTVSTDVLNHTSVRLVARSDRGDMSPHPETKSWDARSVAPSLVVPGSNAENNESLINDVMQTLSSTMHDDDSSSSSASSPLQRFNDGRRSRLGAFPTPPSFTSPSSPLEAFDAGRPILPDTPRTPSFKAESLHPSSPLQYRSKQWDTPSMSSSPPGPYGKEKENSPADGSFVHVIDENGQKVWYPRHQHSQSHHSRTSGFTQMSRVTGTYSQDVQLGMASPDPRQKGSSWVGGPTAGGAYDDRSLMDLQKDGKPVQRAKLVEFTRKQPVSMNDKAMDPNSSCSGDLGAFI